MLFSVITQIAAIFLGIILLCWLAVHFKLLKWDFKKALPEIIVFALIITGILGSRLVTSNYFKTSNVSQAISAYANYRKTGAFSYVESSLMTNVIAPKTANIQQGMKDAFKDKFGVEIEISESDSNGAYKYESKDGEYKGYAYYYEYNSYDIYIFSAEIE